MGVKKEEVLDEVEEKEVKEEKCEECKSKKGSAGLVTILVSCLVVVAAIGGWFVGASSIINTVEEKSTEVSQKNKKEIEENEEQETEIKNEQNDKTDTKVTETNVNSVIGFDSSKSINSNQNNYTLSCQGNAGIWVSVDSTQKVLTFSYTPTRVVEAYSLNWTSSRTDVVSSKINFDKKIVDVFFGGMGQDLSKDTLFILLQDGTVEYIPVVHMFNNTQAEVVSYGKINGVSDVTKFLLSSTSNGNTTLAVKNDGSFYDLWYALKDTGNY